MPPHDRALAPSPFPGDDGTADERTRTALAAAPTGGAVGYLRAVSVLCGERLLVPVVATATKPAESTGGPTTDKEAEMAVVLLTVGDRRALLAFTGLDALRTWRADARPVPVTLDRVAKTAVAEQATAVLVDAAGPEPLVIEGEVLDTLARGHRLVELADGGFGWAIPDPGSGASPSARVVR